MSKSIQQLHEEFVNECRYAGRLSENTLKGYVASLDALRSVFPDIMLKMLTPKMMTEFFRRVNTRKRMVGHGKIKQGIKSSTVVSYRHRLGRFFDWLQVHKHIDSNPFNAMNLPTVRYEDRKYLRKEEIERIFTTVGFTMNWPSVYLRKRNLFLISLFLYTGIRRNELLNLKLTDLDLRNHLLTIRGETSKTGTSRTVPIGSKLLVLLEDYLSERQKRNVLTPCLLASSTRDMGLTDSGLKSLIEKVRKASGVNFHVHQFRHTFAVNLIHQGVDISKVKQLLGHRSILSTMVYLRCLPATALRQDVESLSFDRLL